MTFDVVSWNETTTDLLNWLEANPDLTDGILPTDLNVGSLARAQIEALGVALEQFYFRVHQSLEDAIAQSCYHAFGFDHLAGTAAAGSVVFSALAAATLEITIPSGTVVMTKTGQKFTTTAAGTITAGATASGSIPIQATTIGSAGNVAAGAISVIPYAIENVDAVTNVAATLGGTDEESDASRAARFARFVKTLPRGTAGALEYAACSVSGVASAKAIEPFMLGTPPADCPYAGLVWLWIDTGAGDGTINTGITTQLTKVINGYQDSVEGWVEGWKSAGVVVRLKGVTTQPVKIKGYFTVNDSAKSRFASEIAPLLTAKAASYFSDLSIGESVIHNALMLELASVDSDIVEVALKIWLASENEPSDCTPRNLVLVDSAAPESTGYRAAMDAKTYTNNGSKITYPYWSLA